MLIVQSCVHQPYTNVNNLLIAIRRGLEHLHHRALGVVEVNEKETQCLGDITGPPCKWGT